MSTFTVPDVRHVTLANGLSVALCHAPRLKRCAASIRVAAGSHDVPPAWQGLAHFLEHLFFLGTERFAADEKLMAFVQRHGGQINASTRERTTDFFFELPEQVFAQGLERLCDMLAHPRMTLPEQLSEREVLHAEFIAWSRDATARKQMQLLAGLSARHPLRGFHAGNRYSLPVRRQAFQQALQDFYRRFYHAAQMTLCLAGPQSLDELETLARHHCGAIAAGEPVEQVLPPKLLDGEHTALAFSRSQLLWAFEDLPTGADEAAAFLCHSINRSCAGGLVESLKAEVVYHFAGQLLISTETRLARSVAVEDGSADAAQLMDDWLVHFKLHWQVLRENYNRLQQRHLELAGPLELAHHYARNQPAGLSDQGAVALLTLLEQVQPEASTSKAKWQLPAPNPFLDIKGQGSEGHGSEGAFYLRWRLPSRQPELAQMFERNLRYLANQAKQAGVDLEFSTYGNFWQLKLAGIDAPMPDVLRDALGVMGAVDESSIAQSGDTSAEPALMPIRQLLKVLPDFYLNSQPFGKVANVQAFMAATRWISFSSGLADEALRPLHMLLEGLPGTREEQTLHAPALAPGKHWHHAIPPSSENAMLLFCPVPSASIADEAAWRLLAQIAQTPFYQRLRVELQLGYAVFSGLRQIAGQLGILFGVQSPTASAQVLVGHIEAFLEDLVDRVAQSDLALHAKSVIGQTDTMQMTAAQEAEFRWQAHLRGRGADYSEMLDEALKTMDRTTLLSAAGNLRDATGGWLCLTNSTVNPWQID
jgi:predicted Zn-dependent peptidase